MLPYGRLPNRDVIASRTFRWYPPGHVAADHGFSVPSFVINAAAYTAVDRAAEERATAMVVNAMAPAAMAAACAAKGVPFVQISTDYVFDGQGTAPWQPGDATGPLGAYGRSKLVGEDGIRAAGGTFAILRTSWVFSAHGQNFVRTMLRLSESHDNLRVVADQIGGPTSARAIAGTCLDIAIALTDGTERTEIHHFAGMPDTSWAGFAREIFAQSGIHCEVDGIPTADYPTPARRPLNSRLDCRSLRESFGIIRPDWRIELSEVLKELERPAI